jgi:hypothetical protein
MLFHHNRVSVNLLYSFHKIDAIMARFTESEYIAILGNTFFLSWMED